MRQSPKHKPIFQAPIEIGGMSEQFSERGRVTANSLRGGNRLLQCIFCLRKVICSQQQKSDTHSRVATPTQRLQAKHKCKLNKQRPPKAPKMSNILMPRLPVSGAGPCQLVYVWCATMLCSLGLDVLFWLGNVFIAYVALFS